MATAAQLKALLESHASGDDQRFYATALQVAASEARKGHGKIAKQIRDLVDKRREVAPAATSPATVAHIAEPLGELADLLTARFPTTRLSDLVLTPELERLLKRVVHEHRNLNRIKSHDLHPRQALLLTGPSGCGKTLTASALAGELELPLFVVRIEGLITRYLGDTASKLSQIFEAVQRTRAVYLFDEFDSIGMARGSTNDVGEMRRILNSFLVFIEEQRGNSLVIAATNHGHLLDRALFRRFDDIIEMGLPTLDLAEQTFRFRLQGVKEAKRLSWSKLAEVSEGLSYAEITRVCEEALKDLLLSGKKSLTTAGLVELISERKVFLEQHGKG